MRSLDLDIFKRRDRLNVVWEGIRIDSDGDGALPVVGAEATVPTQSGVSGVMVDINAVSKVLAAESDNLSLSKCA